MSFSLKSLMLGVILIAGIFAALSNSSPIVATVVLNLTILLIMVSAVGGVFSSSQSFYGGFFIFATIYFVIVTFNCIAPQKLLTSKLIDQLFNKMIVEESADPIEFKLDEYKILNWERFDLGFRDIAKDLDRARGVKFPEDRIEERVGPFLVISHCSFTLLLGGLGSVIGTQMTNSKQSRMPSP